MPITDKTLKALNILRPYNQKHLHGCGPLLFASKMWPDSPYRERKQKLMAGSYVGRLVKMGFADTDYKKDHTTHYYITEYGLEALKSKTAPHE